MELEGAAGGAGGVGFALTFVEGKAVLALEGRPIVPLGRVDRLDMEIPNLRFPFDFSGGAARFHGRRCRLREMSVSVSGAELASLLRAARLADFGLLDPQVTIAGGVVRFEATARVGAHEAAFVARGTLVPVPPRRARLVLFDVRLYGFLPIAAPLLATALFASLGAVAASAPPPSLPVAAQAPLLWLEGPTDLHLELLELALLGFLAGNGWRLPERERVSACRVRGVDGRLVVSWSGGADEPAASPLVGEHDAGLRRHAAAETALLAGDVATALEAYRRVDPVETGDAFAATRLLALSVAGESTFAAARALAAAAAARWPEFAPALLAEAAVASGEGRAAEAAALYERAAERASGPDEASDRASALVAAARERGRAGDAAAALATLERALAVCPRHRGAARALSSRLAAEERWQDVLRLLIQRAVDEPDPVDKAALYAEAGFIHLDHLQDGARARDRFDQAVRLAPMEPGGWEGLGRLQGEGGRPALERAFALHGAHADRAGQARVLVTLAGLDDAAGDEPSATARLRAAAALDDRSAEPLRMAGEIAARHERFTEAGRLLEDALARTTDREARAGIVRRLAEVLGGPLGEPMSARVLLEEALADRPCDPGLLDELKALLEREKAGDDWEPFLRRALEQARRPEEQKVALCRLRDLARARGDRPELGRSLVALIAAGGEERAGAVAELAELSLTPGQPPLAAEARAALTALLTDEQALVAVAPHTRAELAWRLAALLDRRGDQQGTLRWLRACLEGEVEGAMAASAWRRFVEIAARRGEASAAAQALVAWADDSRTGEGERDRAAHLVAAAEIFRERLELPEDAVVLLERALALDPLNDAAFVTLEAAATRMKDWPRLAEVLAQRLEVARTAEQRPLLTRLGRVLDELGRADEAAEVYRRLLDVDPEDATALIYRARQLWATGAKPAAGAHFERLLELEGVAAADRAEAELRLAQWLRVVGKLPEAQAHLEAALAGEPQAGAPAAVLVEALEAFGRIEDLVVRLERRQGAARTDEARREVARVRAVVLERVGRSGEAAAIYRELLAAEPEAVPVLQRLAEIFRRDGRGEELAPILERLWQMAGGGQVDINGEAVGLELAALLAERLAAPDRAEMVLRELLVRFPGSGAAIEALSVALATRGAHEEADAMLLRRADLPGDPVAKARALAARARQRLGGADGGRAAFALLARAERAALDRPALALRAQLAEAQGDVVDALWSVRMLRASLSPDAPPGDAAALEERLVALAARPELAPADAAAILEEMLGARTPATPVAEALAAVYERLPDLRARNRALATLLERGLPLGEPGQARIHLLLAETAEADGDLPGALEAFERSLALDSEPTERARQLVGHARMLVLRREVEDALVDVAEALTLVPEHAPALALRAELAFRNQDWEEARRSYARLAVAPDADLAIAPALLAFRRAVLAETFGEDAEAEAAYLEAANLNPAHLESREALAQIALYRRDLPEAARRLEEVLRLLPLDALEKIRDARERLGGIYFELGDHAAARHYLELVLAEEPDREVALEVLVPVYEHLQLGDQAAALCERLARVYSEPERRARALYRQGEILRLRGDRAAANDAYLRACDLDPASLPTLVRLAEYYWAEGDFANLADIGAELVSAADGANATLGPDVGLMVALGAALAGRGTALAPRALRGVALEADAVAARLVELGARLWQRPPEVLDPALELLSQAVAPAGFAKAVGNALARRVVAGPREAGALLALARHAERRGDLVTARAAYAVLYFVQPNAPVGPRLAALGSGGPPRPETWAPGAVDHVSVRIPLRRVLRALSRPLAGFGRISSRSRVVGIGLGSDAVTRLEELRLKLDAPPFRAVLQTEVIGAVVAGTRPVTVAVGPRTLELPPAELAFIGARALEDARSGTFIAAALGSDGLRDLLRALAALLARGKGNGSGSGELDKTLAAWLVDPENRSLIPPEPARGPLTSDLQEALRAPLDAPAFLRGCRFSGDRIGLLACGSPLAALRAMAASTDPSGRADPDAETAFRELVAFLFSVEYRALAT
jgi:tetratricopeptide (TPR) repeat protein